MYHARLQKGRRRFREKIAETLGIEGGHERILEEITRFVIEY